MDRAKFPLFFGEWVKKRRKVLDLTQEELAQRAGCSVFALRKIESGERRPSKQLAELLARSLEISSDEKQTFIRVARGETNLERLSAPHPDLDLASIPKTSSVASTILRTQPAPVPSRVPLPPTSLIGRDTELAAMDRLFKEPHCRLLTLTGMGGIGKTRLALEFACQQFSEFPGGIYYVPLASIASVEAIVPGIAEAIGFAFSGTSDPKEQLLNYIAMQIKQPLLLVLDNLEHLLVQSSSEEKNGIVGLVSEFLQRLPNVRILTTSRERLNLQGEWMYELHGLAIPPQEFAGSLDDYSATTLFIQSARRAKADFTVTEKERPALIEICQLLGGVPLAIELAAAWLGMLSCQEIAQEINSNIDFLTTSMRDIPERHRSLRATFEHSWKLLSTEERKVLCRLSVFHGGFDRNAAEKISGATLPLLASLVSKSLVRRAGDGRYDLHEVIRQYAMSHLDENPSQYLETCDLHSDYYLKLVAEYEKALKSAAQQQAVRDLSKTLDNIRTAWDWGIQRKKFELVGRAVRSVGWFFEVAGLLREGISQLEPLIQTLKTEPRNEGIARALGLALSQQGLLCFRSGRFSQAQALYQESIAILRPIGDQIIITAPLVFLGILTHLNGDYSQSKILVEEALVYAQSGNDKWFEAYAIYNLGYVESLMGAYQKGYEQMMIGLDMWRALGDPHYIALGLNFLVTTLIKLGRYKEAKAFMQESIALCEKTKNRWGLGTAYIYLGLTAMAEAQYTEAKANFSKSLDIFSGYTEGYDIALSLTYLGEATMLAEDLSEARNIFWKALHISMDANSIPITLNCLVGLAQLSWKVGDAERAFEISSFVSNHAASTRDIKERAEQIKSAAEASLNRGQIRVIKAKAADQALETIVDRLISR